MSALGKLLSSIASPADLKLLDFDELQDLCGELRSFIIESVSETGGHLASNLGVIELTVALHYVFETPKDHLVWDVGHQSYAHKILTGRRAGMKALRKVAGLSGFPSRDESPHDSFGAGHAGTAISAALGLALGLQDQGHKAIAIVGDSALSAGMAFEALNHAGGFPKLPLTIVLNDNGMSISPAVGGLDAYLGALRANTDGDTTLFEKLGIEYVGPIDGHDMNALVLALQDVKFSAAPRLIHVMTQKGRGYERAESDPVSYHGPGAFDPAKGLLPKRSGRHTYSQVFGEWLCDAARADARVWAITPAMREGSGLVEFEREFPGRYLDTAIAEQHAVTLAAGLAAAGQRPVVAIYSTFLQRGYDQLVHDVALQRLPVLFALDRAGIAGGDGATHLGAFDIAALRCIPNMVLMTPANEPETYQMLATGLAHAGPSAVRYPRATGSLDIYRRDPTPLPIGKGQIRRESQHTGGFRVALLAFGPLLDAALEAASVLDATVANMLFVKPLDVELVHALAREHDLLVTIEEGVRTGGAGAACVECLADAGIATRVLRLGLPDAFVEHGDRSQLLAQLGLDAAGIVLAVGEQFGASERSGIASSSP